MSLIGHVEALKQKHTQMEEAIRKEALRPMPDTEKLSALKCRRLHIKEELLGMNSQLAQVVRTLH